MITDYKSRKNEVLASHKKVEDLVAEITKNAQRIGVPGPLERLEPLLTDIRSKVEKIRNDRFSLMIAGESKSGKSTFINAYLGVELLPMDVKQCTSAIIEIKNGEEFYVRATYANGDKKEIRGDAEAREFLKKNAALDDEYRDIPVPTINSEIIVKSGMRAANKGTLIKILKAEIEDFLNALEVQEANIHNIPVQDYNRKIKKYIEERKNSWQTIVTKIEVVFPFGEEMRGIEIIDSPGVCARGGVAEITSQYIENADAIIFLKPVSGQALESTQFNQFIKNASVARNKNALFLVLTRTTNVTPEDLRRLEGEAYQQFNNIDKNNILFVDSKAELYAKKLANIDEIEAELRRLNQAGTLDDFVVKAYNDVSGLFGNGDKNDFIKVLSEKSRFEQVYNAMETFGRKAHYILLVSLLDSICDLYRALYSDLNFQMDIFQQKAEDPTELSIKIATTKKELDILEDKMRSGVDKVRQHFRSDDGLIRSSAEKAVSDYKKQISLIDENSSDAFSELERESIKKINGFKVLAIELQENIITEFDKELVSLSDNSTISFEWLRPNFTQSTFAEIRASTESKATERQSYEEGVTFKETHTRSIYSRGKHYNLIKTNILSRLQNIKGDLIKNLIAFVDNVSDRYISELKENARTKKKELDIIIEAKITAEQIKEIINNLTILLTNVTSEQSDAEKIKGGIVKNVQ
ncbi:dynamin family protein [Phytobacter diazotrophicus]|uniref:dynamin family protein n=1 Tax=Phytobacter diazotrophicus TaxID=395631 RepID=UPI00232D1567|nr:dynamin family protein [Phytobacter diazotrophicus]MDC0726545.1 dynamin family protein [Phytobacter diazotrophicus]MDC0733900.1 dynamin family protein [Phytobacter diazotrophicus]